MDKILTILGLFSLMLYLSSCSSSGQKVGADDQQNSSVLKATWINTPYNLCLESREFCAVGSGGSLEQADQAAKSELASILSTEVKSTFDTLAQSSEVNDKKFNFFEENRKTIEVKTHQILKGVQIKVREQRSDIYYSLAAVDKGIWTQDVAKELEVIESEIDSLMSKNQRSSLHRLKFFAEQRMQNQAIYLVVSGKNYPEKYSYQSIMSKFDANQWPIKRVLLKLKNNQSMARNSFEYLKSKIIQTGHTLSLDESKYDVSCSMNMNDRKDYLNVDGFSKFNFIITVDCLNASGSKIGHFILQKASTGRTLKDSFSKIENELYKDLSLNIYLLNI